MSSSEFSNPESLEVLTEMLNQTLIETGRFFRSGGSLQSRAQLKRVLPQSQGEFQCALDNLSEQIFIAKAFLERDYAEVKARKAAPRKRPLEDVAMEEPEAPSSTTVPVPEQTAVKTSPSQEVKAEDNEVKVEQQAEPKKDQQETTNGSAEEGAQGAGAAPAAEVVQNSGDTEQGLYDSLLNNSGSNEFGINLDFGDDGNAGNDNFFNTNFGDSNAGSGLEGGNTQMPNAEPGHDNSALPMGGDAFDLELQKFTNQDPNEQFGNSTDDIMGPGESSFDDLFMESENMGGNDNGDNDLLGGDELMQLNELDDSWFT
ncbi:hypothetical protein BDV18DRAFT_80534 [Aspergillus unguis]